MKRASVVVETLNARRAPGAVREQLSVVLEAVRAQTVEAEVIIVLVAGEDDLAAEIVRAHPDIRVAFSERENYFAMKNAGARAATADHVAYCDSDTRPEPEWLEQLLLAIERTGCEVAQGATVYSEEGRLAAALGHAAFMTSLTEDKGGAENVSLSNVCYRRDVLLAHPFDERVRRDGACYLQFRRLRRDGIRAAYAPHARIQHAAEQGIGYVRKHFSRGYDGLSVYRLDADGVLKGTRWVRRFGAIALLPITLRRFVLDLRLLGAASGDGRVPRRRLPLYAAVLAWTRTVELVGGLTAGARGG